MHRAGHACVFVGVLGCAMAAVGAVLEWWDVPLEEEGTVSIKADHYRLHRDEIDLVFVGSSRVFRQVHVPVFQRTLAERGLEVRAYNYGLPGMRFLESLATVEWLLDREGEALRWIVLELQDPEPSRPEARRFTRRNLRWHTPRLTALALRRVWATDGSAGDAWGEAAGHLGQGLLHFANAGTALPALRALLGWGVRVPDRTPGGYLPLESEARKRDIRERRDTFLHDLALKPDLLEERRRRALLAPALPPPQWLARELRSLADRAARHGVELCLWILPPAEHNWLALSRLRELPDVPKLFAQDPARYPELYFDATLRFDLRHLNVEGSKQLTALFARQFARHVERRAR